MSKLCSPTIRTCYNYRNKLNECITGPDSDRCSRCVSNGVKCNLVVSSADIVRLETARKKAWEEIRDTQAKLNRLHKVFERLEEQKQKIAERELKNIEELEADEAAVSSSKESNNTGPPPDIPPGEFEFPDFDFPAMSLNTLDRALAEFSQNPVSDSPLLEG